jgi:hypothetical protein
MREGAPRLSECGEGRKEGRKRWHWHSLDLLPPRAHPSARPAAGRPDSRDLFGLGACDYLFAPSMLPCLPPIPRPALLLQFLGSRRGRGHRAARPLPRLRLRWPVPSNSPTHPSHLNQVLTCSSARQYRPCLIAARAQLKCRVARSTG